MARALNIVLFFVMVTSAGADATIPGRQLAAVSPAECTFAITGGIANLVDASTYLATTGDACAGDNDKEELCLAVVFEVLTDALKAARAIMIAVEKCGGTDVSDVADASVKLTAAITGLTAAIIESSQFCTEQFQDNYATKGPMFQIKELCGTVITVTFGSLGRAINNMIIAAQVCEKSPSQCAIASLDIISGIGDVVGNSFQLATASCWSKESTNLAWHLCGQKVVASVSETSDLVSASIGIAVAANHEARRYAESHAFYAVGQDHVNVFNVGSVALFSLLAIGVMSIARRRYEPQMSAEE